MEIQKMTEVHAKSLFDAGKMFSLHFLKHQKDIEHELYSEESISIIDSQFFSEKPDRIMDRETTIFYAGLYFGNTIIKNLGGEYWKKFSMHTASEYSEIFIKIPSIEFEFNPFRIALKRARKGKKESLLTFYLDIKSRLESIK